MECLATRTGSIEYGSHDRFRNWEAQGFFHRLWQAELQHYDELAGKAWTLRGHPPLSRHPAVGPAPDFARQTGNQTERVV